MYNILHYLSIFKWPSYSFEEIIPEYTFCVRSGHLLDWRIQIASRAYQSSRRSIRTFTSLSSCHSNLSWCANILIINKIKLRKGHWKYVVFDKIKVTFKKIRLIFVCPCQSLNDYRWHFLHWDNLNVLKSSIYTQRNYLTRNSDNMFSNEK